MKWNNIVKEQLSWAFAALSFVGGWGITIAGFCVHPVGEIHATVIVIFGQAMMITGALIGINLKFKNEGSTLTERLTSVINDTIERKFREHSERNTDSHEDFDEGIGG